MIRHPPDWYDRRRLICHVCSRVLTSDWSVIRGKLLCPACATAALQAEGRRINDDIRLKRPEFDV